MKNFDVYASDAGASRAESGYFYSYNTCFDNTNTREYPGWVIHET